VVFVKCECYGPIQALRARSGEETMEGGAAGQFGSEANNLWIGRRLRHERRLAGMSQEAMAQVLGVSAETIEKYENGGKPLPAHHFAQAVTALDVSLSAFFFEGTPLTPKDDEAVDQRWVAIPRPLKLLSLPDFVQVAPLFHLWKKSRGELTEDIEDALLVSGLLERMILVHDARKSSPLVVEHFGSHITIVKSSDIVGREIAAIPDREYAARVGESYSQVLWHRLPAIESCRAIIRTWDAKTICARYDRVFIPWRWRGFDQFAMCFSLRRGRLAEMPYESAAIPL
jgi:transcriptional regulator with XRE-family HTH domain